jgi:penicillin-binding protein 1C
LGEVAEKTAAQDCHVRQSAWVLDGRIPPTLPNLQKPSWSAGLQHYWVNLSTGLRVTAECASPLRGQRQFAQWPVELWPWLAGGLLDRMHVPALDASCPTGMRLQADHELKILGLDDTSKLYLGKQASVSIDLRAQDGQGDYLWLVNGELAGRVGNQQPLRHTFRQAGDYTLTVQDEAGAVDNSAICVVAP